MGKDDYSLEPLVGLRRGALEEALSALATRERERSGAASRVARAREREGEARASREAQLKAEEARSDGRGLRASDLVQRAAWLSAIDAEITELGASVSRAEGELEASELAVSASRALVARREGELEALARHREAHVARVLARREAVAEEDALEAHQARAR